MMLYLGYTESNDVFHDSSSWLCLGFTEIMQCIINGPYNILLNILSRFNIHKWTKRLEWLPEVLTYERKYEANSIWRVWFI